MMGRFGKVMEPLGVGSFLEEMGHGYQTLKFYNPSSQTDHSLLPDLPASPFLLPCLPQDGMYPLELYATINHAFLKLLLERYFVKTII